jgi:hypothetical protein
MVVVDADVMIEVLRKNPSVASYLRNDIGAFAAALERINSTEKESKSSLNFVHSFKLFEV